MNKYKKKLESILDDKICDVPTEIGTPILDKFTYVRDEDISDLFVNLLTTASSKDTIEMAHPSFLDAVNSLSGDEATILNNLIDKSYVPYITIKAKRKDGGGAQVIGKRITNIAREVGLIFPENTGIYFEHFVSLGILECSDENYISDDTLYKDLIELLGKAVQQTDIPNISERGTEQYFPPFIEKGYYNIMDYGRMFIKACTSTVKDE